LNGQPYYDSLTFTLYQHFVIHIVMNVTAFRFGVLRDEVGVAGVLIGVIVAR
jgi:hypothetical protein